LRKQVPCFVEGYRGILSHIMFNHQIKNVLLTHGILISQVTSEREVKEFLSKVAPYATDKTLIRVGGDEDGGYLIPNDLQGVDYCFSPGVGKTAKFENDLASRGIRSFLADYSVEGPPVQSDMFRFDKKFLGVTNEEMFMTLQVWIEKSLPNSSQDLILQMDIEGNEYEVILDTPKTVWERFRIVVVEFHGLQNIFNQYGIKFISYCFCKLLSSFDIVHIHPNNILPPAKRSGCEIPNVMEITFLRKDRVQRRERSTVFPHPLDRPNLPHKPDVILHPCWYKGD